jgi:sulfonate transport system permease protein
MTSLVDAKVLRAVDASAPETRTVRRRRLGRARTIPFGRLLGVLLLIGVWSLASALGALDPRKLSAPWTVAATGLDLIADGTLQANVGASLNRVALGFAFGVVIGTALALVAGLSRVGATARSR